MTSRTDLLNDVVCRIQRLREKKHAESLFECLDTLESLIQEIQVQKEGWQSIGRALRTLLNPFDSWNDRVVADSARRLAVKFGRQFAMHLDDHIDTMIKCFEKTPNRSVGRRLVADIPKSQYMLDDGAPPRWKTSDSEARSVLSFVCAIINVYSHL